MRPWIPLIQARSVSDCVGITFDTTPRVTSDPHPSNGCIAPDTKPHPSESLLLPPVI